MDTDLFISNSMATILEFAPIPGYKELTVSRILVDTMVLILVLLVARILIWVVDRLIIRRLAYFQGIDYGREFAIRQISKYVIYILAFSIILDRLHVGSIIFTSLAGLFVGIGFGLQQTFNDLTSGLILLFESNVKVGDIVEVSSTVGKVRSIGIRTSTVETRDLIMITVPNSKLTAENVINWTKEKHATRFRVRVGVSYGSNVDLVKEKLIAAAVKHPLVTDKIEYPYVIFNNFGESSLEFDLIFWTENVWDIEITRSDIRFNIEQLFRENKIKFAFPQRDVNLKWEK